MKFFEQQQKAKRKTKLLLVYFILGVSGTIVLVYLAVLLILGYGFKGYHFKWWNPDVFFYVFIFTSLIILIATIAKIIELSNGGKTVAIALGGEKITNPQGIEEQRLLNIVNEMAIASGLPIPEVYVLREERGINAFAAGNSPSDAVIGVTEGAVKHLTRDELQGVIAHEFSHILNGDMRMNIKLIAAICGILVLTEIGYAILRIRTKGKGGGQIKLFALALLLIGSCGALFARIIQSAISRQREYLADAAAVQFTRNPSGIAGALKKIATLSYGSRIMNPNSSAMAHMFFSAGFKSFLSSLFATHPPIEKRIKAIEEMASGTIGISEEVVRFPKGAEEEFAPEMSPKFDSQILVSNLVASAGTVNPAASDYYKKLLNSLDPMIVNSLQNLFDATAIVYALLLSNEDAARHKQIERLSRLVSSAMFLEVSRKYEKVKTLPRIKKLPLAHLAIITLKSMSRNQYMEFKKVINELIQCDNNIDLFEFALSKIIQRNLEPHFTTTTKFSIKLVKQGSLNSLEPVKQNCAVLLSALAWSGHDNLESAKKAFKIGANILGFSSDDFNLLPYEKCNLNIISAALDSCLKLEPILRQKLISACSAVVSEDNVLTPFEAELLRAIAETLECPIPPILYE